MASTFTNLGVELMATGENAGTWGTKTNANLNLAEQLLGGFKIQTLNAAGTGANTTALAIADGALTGAAQNRVIILGAVSPQAITGNKIVTFPLLTETFYFIKNSTSGAYTVQLKAVSGSGATVTFSATDKGYKVVYLDGVATNTGVIEVPLGEDGDVTLTGTQTLTNKTLTSPKIGTSILDTSGNELALLTATGSAVNEFTLANAATGNNPTISATGGDTNVGITLTPKGTGEIVIAAGNLNYGATAVTATGAELNYSDLATLGTSAASKVLTANANNLTTISGAVLNTEDTLTDGSTIAWNVINSPVAKVTLAGNRTMAAPSGTGPAAGQFISLLAIQDGTGSRTITWNAVYEFPSDTAPTLTTTANLGDIFSFRYNGAKWLLIGQTLALTLS
jgi:hypothetical protein